MQNTKIKLDFKVVILGILSAITFEATVQVIPLEIIGVVYFLSKFGRFPKFQNRSVRNFLRRILLSGFLLIIIQIFTDLYFEAPILETIKSVAQIITLIALIFAGINLLSLSDRKSRSFIIGYILSSIVSFVFFRDDYVKIDPWKFLFANISTILLLYLIGLFRIGRWTAIFLLFSLASSHLVLGSRSTALFTIIAILPMIIPSRFKAKASGLFFLVITALVLIFLAENLYQNLSLSGSLGVSQQQKARQQFESGPLLLFARSELLYEINAIKENPFIGKGSNPDLSNTILFQVAESEGRIGLQTKKTAAFQGYTNDGKIPQHSMLFGSWVEAGLMGLLFWTIILVFILQNLSHVLRSKSEFANLTFYLLVATVWGIFFSPLGAGSRMLVALTISTLVRIVIIENKELELNK